jgi:hypothetical protein
MIHFDSTVNGIVGFSYSHLYGNHIDKASRYIIKRSYSFVIPLTHPSQNLKSAGSLLIRLLLGLFVRYSLHSHRSQQLLD